LKIKTLKPPKPSKPSKPPAKIVPGLKKVLLIGINYFESPDNFEELKKTIDNIIKYKITKDHLRNYFNYLFTQANDYINKNVN